jgi:hypothetical protein
MHHWVKRLVAVAALLLPAGCLWSPGKFTSDLALRRDGSFVLDYRGEILIQLPPDKDQPQPWKDSLAHCYEGMDNLTSEAPPTVVPEGSEAGKERPCTKAQVAAQRADYERRAAAKRKEAEDMARAFGLPGLDEQSNRAFAAKLMKYSGWRSVTYRGKGVYDVDYHAEGRLTQDLVFPLMPDNNIIIPFIAIRRRADGAVLVDAPALAGSANILGPLAQQMSDDAKSTTQSRAQGRFTVHTDGRILTNNSEDGPTADPLGQQVHWDIGPGSTKLPETLIGL